MSYWLRNGLIGSVLLFLAAPLLVVGGVSINSTKSLIFPPRGFSLQWYSELFTRSEWLMPMANSLGIACIAAAIASSIAIPIAYSLWRTGKRYPQFLFYLGLAPAVLPPVVIAISFLGFWASIGAYGSIYATILSHAILLIPFPLVTSLLGLRSIQSSIVEASRTLGANESAIFATIVLPLIQPYLIAGYAFAFVFSLNEYIVSFMVSGFTVETLPIKIFNSLHYGYTPVMACVTILFIALAALLFALVNHFGSLLQLLSGSAGTSTKS
ncbi:ABC transporter permease [Leptolyngbya ohadii]|uniref:ABC transporter permease n=1 Tax=Leptolyngbya ohadii TaxID=1962290 RepID=UPI000B59B35B|nr:ABC transporter permease [Leptolyngbya ohadii]